MSPPSANGPLAGLKILEFGQIAAGPFAGSLLADLGADVVKVEKPDGGDDMRRWPPMSAGPDGPDYSENFASVNRIKEASRSTSKMRSRSRACASYASRPMRSSRISAPACSTAWGLAIKR